MAANPLDRLPLIGATRHNHSLEHATLQVLAEKYHNLRMSGVSFAHGFYLDVDLPTEIITRAALEAEKRLKAGESNLAVHPHCGTNLVVPATVAAGFAWLTWQFTRKRKQPSFIQVLLPALVAMPAFFLARPLGPVVQQKVMTSADIGDKSIRQVVSMRYGNTYFHKISTEG
jgi:hypothetical protein